MKLSVALLSAAAAVSAAQPHHQHQHAHLHQREANPTPAGDVVFVPGPTEVVYILDGKPISAAEVEAGLANGTLVLGPGGELAPASESTSSSAAAPTFSADTKFVLDADLNVHASVIASSSAPAAPSSSVVSSSVSSSFSAQASSSASASTSASSSFNSNAGTGVNSEFPDGQLDCSTFPSAYGAVAVDYMNLGGWIGVQTPGNILEAAFNDIMTAVAGGTCTEGSFCSYACPAGYQKSQWPSKQGATGQSIGGIQCRNGKLHLTNPSLSKSLCIQGASEVTVQIKNTLGSNVAVCRTDYPGTESETVPLNAVAGTTSPLTCPNSADYYTWEGASTSAQYYVNPAGVAVSDACQWGSAANPWGNFAPMNLGVGYSNGAAYLSIFQNLPTTSAKLGFTVEIQGDNMSGKCRYSNGQYCSGENYENCSSTTGCTVAVSSGTATYVFS